MAPHGSRTALAQSARLVIARRLDRRDHVHGAWWPSSKDVQSELALMLPVALTRLPAVLGVSLNRDEWPGAPLVCQPLTNRSPKVSWYGTNEPNLAVLHCGRDSRVTLLVIPADTSESVALAAMLLSATPGHGLTAAQTMARATEQARRTDRFDVADDSALREQMADVWCGADR